MITLDRPLGSPEFRPAELAAMSTEEAIHALFQRALELQASDLFLLSDARLVSVSVRRWGHLERIAVLSTEFGRQLMAYIKAFAEMDICEKRRPADGRWVLQLDEHRLDMRINFTPTLHGEDVTIRITDHARGFNQLSDLGLTATGHQKLQRLLQMPNGLLVVTGPTGAGKTTTLYACLRFLHDGSRKINTLEDPVEYAIEGIRQSQVNPKLGLDFAELLRSVLRQAPDIVMVGEIRDPETMAIALRAANSGLLVLATLHAPTAADAVQSMLALNANPFFLANCLLGIVSQRLVHPLCPVCRVPTEWSAEPALQPEFSLLTEGPTTVYRPGSCRDCHETGYLGRTGLFEILPVNSEVRQLVSQGAASREIENAAVRAGMTTLRRGALLQLAQGLTSVEEVLPWCTDWVT